MRSSVFLSSNTEALLDRLTHRGHVLLVEGDSYRLRESLLRKTS